MIPRPDLPEFTVPLFGGEVVLCRTRAEWDAAMDFFGGAEEWKATKGSAGLATVIRSSSGNRVYLIGVFDKSIGTLSHELSHVVFYICGDVGVPVTAGEDNETFAYLLGHLMYEILPAFGAKQHAGRK